MTAPQGVEPVEQQDREGRSGQEGQGPFFVIQLKWSEGRIAMVSFRTVGCKWSNGIGAALARLAKGKTAVEACYITEANVEKELDGVPRDKIHFLPMAIQALRSAL